jgi:hypothetical protein
MFEEGLGCRRQVRSVRRFPVSIILCTFVAAGVMSGCLDEAPLDANALSGEAPAVSDLFRVEMGHCVEGGSVSMYNIADNPMVPEPWEAEDIREDMGNPVFGSYGNPITGPATGIWHMSVICDSYDYEGTKTTLMWGWVGVRVKPPPWDDGTVKRQFILADLSFGDDDIQATLADGPGFHVSKTLGATIEWLYGSDVIHTVMQDTSHGKFETFAGLKEYRALDLPDTRFWFPVNTMAGHDHESDASETEMWKPVSLDFTHAVATDAEHWVVNENARAFAHTKDQPVGPAKVPGIEHYGYTGAAVLFETFDRTMTLGPAPEGILLETTYTH